MTGSPDAAPTPAKTLGADTPTTNFEVGAKVRVVVEGEVNPNTGGDYLYVDSGNGRSHGFFLPNLNTPVEVLTPPAPTFLDGDVIRATKSPQFVAVRQSGHWSWTDSPSARGPQDDAVAGYLASGFYTPIRVGGKAVTP